MNKPYLNISSNRLFRQSGALVTTNPDPTAISSLMRPGGSKVFINGDYNEYMSLSPFIFDVGEEIEFQFKNNITFYNSTQGWLGDSNTSTNRINIRMSDGRVYIIINGVIFSLPTASLNTTTYYTFKIKRLSTYVYEIWREGVSYGTLTHTQSTTMSINQFGRAGSSFPYLKIVIEYIRFGSLLIYNLNEVGSDPTIYTDVYYK
jgi:hypothetical protein